MTLKSWWHELVHCRHGNHLRRDFIGSCCLFKMEQDELMDIVEATHEFMVVGQQIEYYDGKPLPEWDGDIDSDIRQNRINWLTEEFTETMIAEAQNDPVEVADGLADVIVVAAGTLIAYFGYEVAREILDAVAVSNLDKVEDGPIFDEAGKIQKPSWWSAPPVRNILERAGFLD